MVSLTRSPGKRSSAPYVHWISTGSPAAKMTPAGIDRFTLCSSGRRHCVWDRRPRCVGGKAGVLQARRVLPAAAVVSGGRPPRLCARAVRHRSAGSLVRIAHDEAIAQVGAGAHESRWATAGNVPPTPRVDARQPWERALCGLHPLVERRDERIVAARDLRPVLRDWG